MSEGKGGKEIYDPMAEEAKCQANAAWEQAEIDLTRRLLAELWRLIPRGQRMTLSDGRCFTLYSLWPPLEDPEDSVWYRYRAVAYLGLKFDDGSSFTFKIHGSGRRDSISIKPPIPRSTATEIAP